jgi:hypothetical protein
LRRLCLSTGELSNRAIDEIRHIETLQILDLSGTNVDDNGLAKLATLKNLKLLYLKDEEKITNQGLENFAPMAHLEALNLSKNDWIRSSGISGLAKLPALKILRMDSCKLSAPVLVPMKKLKHLKLLALRGSNVADDGVDQLVDTTIEQLDLEKTNISDRSLRTLAKMRYLKELGLNQCSVSQSAIDKLQQERPNLRIWEHDGVPFNSRHDNQ